MARRSRAARRRGQRSGVRRRRPCVREQALGNGAIGLSACFASSGRFAGGVTCLHRPAPGDRTGLFVHRGCGALEGTLAGNGVSTARAGLGGVDEPAGPAPGALEMTGLRPGRRQWTLRLFGGHGIFLECILKQCPVLLGDSHAWWSEAEPALGSRCECRRGFPLARCAVHLPSGPVRGLGGGAPCFKGCICKADQHQ